MGVRGRENGLPQPVLTLAVAIRSPCSSTAMRAAGEIGAQRLCPLTGQHPDSCGAPEPLARRGKVPYNGEHSNKKGRAYGNADGIRSQRRGA